jgi:hypothetical protein
MTRLPGFAQRVVALDVSLRFVRQGQRLRRLYRRRVHWLPVDQAMQQVQNMRLGRDASLQRQFDGGEHGLFVVLENESQDLDHLAVAAWRLKHALLQSPEGRRQLGEGRAIAQGSGLALNDRQIMPPVENGGRTLAFMGAGKNAAMFADDLSLGGDNDAFGIDSYADRAIGEGRWHAVAIALQMDQARRRHALGVFDEAVERPGKRHQMLDLFGPGVGNRARMRGVRRLSPQLPAALLQPVVQRR